MTANEAYEKLYQGALRDFNAWSEAELLEVFKLARADARDKTPEKARDEILQSIEAELVKRGGSVPDW